MTTVITFLAKPPAGLSEGASDGNAAIALTASMMETAIAGDSLGYQAQLVRVAYVGDIARALAQLPAPPDLIQIVGHGSPGRLQLGGFWGPSPDRPHECDVLDSSPESYGLLQDWLRPETLVMLLGCGVGGASPPGYVASGRALLFDLEDMTHGHAYAADSLVTPDSFRDGFLYSGSLVTSTGKPANPAGNVIERARARYHEPQEPPPEHAEPLELVVESVRTAPALGFGHATPPRPPSNLQAIPVWPPPGSLLAMTELELATDHGIAEVICGGEYLRMHHDGQPCYYTYQVGRAPKETWFSSLREAYLRDDDSSRPR